MLNQPLVIARKELQDALRDGRSLVSSLFYSLIGPAVVLMVARVKPDGHEVLTAMASIFAMVSAFSGGMNVAMDAIAGERERRSLLPLLLNPVIRSDVAMGKWLAVAVFSCAGLAINLAAFSLVLASPSLLFRFPLLLPLCLLAAALEVLTSTWCRTVKEAHTYLSFLVFLPMLAGMFAVFAPRRVEGWGWSIPVLGQQFELSGHMTGAQAGMLFAITLIAALAVLYAAGNRLEQDDVVYGN
jgi:sodium transport system permease protein